MSVKTRSWSGSGPNRIVEENRLQAQISALRKAFAADRNLICTIAVRGYQFTGVIHAALAKPDVRPSSAAAVPIRASAQTPANFPEPVSELIGRDGELPSQFLEDRTERNWQPFFVARQLIKLYGLDELLQHGS